MEHIRNFLRGKGFVLALLACVAAAAAAGVWAVRTIRDQMAEDLGEKPSQSITGEETFPGADGGLAPDREEQVWQQDAAGAAQSVADLPESSSSGASSGAPSGSGSVSEPSELQTESPAASASAGSGYTRPVSGRVLAVWSGDELVYNETLGDWRTHNGVDYACEAGEGPPVAGLRPGGRRRQPGGRRHGRAEAGPGRQHHRRKRARPPHSSRSAGRGQVPRPGAAGRKLTARRTKGSDCAHRRPVWAFLFETVFFIIAFARRFWYY